MFGIVIGGVGVFVGYLVGWSKGYEQKDQDDIRIEHEMNDFWKDVKNHGL